MGIKQTLIRIKWKPAEFVNKMSFRLRKFHYGTSFRTYGMIFIRGTGQIAVGDNVTITSCRETNPIGGDVKTILFAKGNSKITIGNHVGISNSALVALNSITVEENVMIGGGCKIYDNDFHPLKYDQRINMPNENVIAKPVVIKKGAFIGAHSIILKGVTIGEKSIIGAGSVVTKSIPDGEIWAGNPVHFIRKV